MQSMIIYRKQLHQVLQVVFLLQPCYNPSHLSSNTPSAFVLDNRLVQFKTREKGRGEVFVYWNVCGYLSQNRGESKEVVCLAAFLILHGL